MSKYGDALEAMQRERAEREQERARQVETVAKVAQRYNPDQYAEAIDRAAELDLPAHIVADNPQAFAGKSKYGQALDQLDAPATHEWLTDLDNAAVAQDDTENLSGVERYFRNVVKSVAGAAGASPETRETFARWPVNTARLTIAQAKSGFAGVAEFLADRTAAINLAAANSYKVRPDAPEWERKQAQAAIDEAIGRVSIAELQSGRMQRIARRGRFEADEAIPKDAGVIERAAMQGVSSAVTSLGATLLAGPAGGASVLGVSTFGSRYAELKDLDFSTRDATMSGLALGAMEILTEYLPGRALVKDSDSFFAKAVEFMASELPGENIASLTEMLDDYRLQLRDDITAADLAASFRDTSLATVIGGGVQLGAVHVLSRAAELANERAAARAAGIDLNAIDEATRRKAEIDLLHTAAQNTKLATRSPAKLEELVSVIKEQTGSEFAYIDPVAFRTLYQSDQEAADAAAELTGSPTTYFEAAVSNTKIAVPIEKYVARVAANTNAQALTEHVTFTPDGLTAAEAKIERELLDGRANEIADREAADVPEDKSQAIYDDVMGQLLATGMERSTAEKNAALTQAVYRTLAQRTRQDPVALYERYGLKVQRHIPGVGAIKRVDARIDPLIDQLRAGDIPSPQRSFGRSMLEFIRETGGLKDDGGDLAALDVDKGGKAFQRNVIQQNGRSLDDMAELLVEAGYISERDPNLVLDLISRELSGAPVYAAGNLNSDSAGRRADLEWLERLISRAGIDLKTADNETVKKALALQESDSAQEGLTTFDQRFDEIQGNGFSAPALVSPEALEFREQDQSRLDAVRELFPDDEYSPIVAIEDGGKLSILDGHNRATVARERGHLIPVVKVTAEEYADLQANGFDDIEIAYAALTRAKQDDAASDLNRQFPGAGVDRRGSDAWQKLPDVPNISTEQIKSAVGNRGTFDPTSPNILFQSSVKLRTGREDLAKFGLTPGKTHTTREIAAALEARQRERSGAIPLDDRSEAAEKRIAKWMQEEVEHELQPEARANAGAGWYSEKFQRALDVLGEMFPELRSDKTARGFFTALVAITSDGQKVYTNFRGALDLYRAFRETGKLPEETTFGGERVASVRANIQVINQLVAEMGQDGMRDFLLQEFTVSQLNKIAKEKGIDFSSAYKADTRLPMSALVFGPKLGAFYANLMGANAYLTMDRWWSRTFNRYRGTLLQKPTPQGLARFRGLLGKPDLTDEETIEATKPYRASYFAKGFKHGTEIEKAANTIYKMAFENLEDTPANASDREFMLRVVNRVVKNLKRKGIQTSIADIQAILWYFEKRLYAELGARASADVSYEEVAHRIVRESGAAGPAGTAGGQSLATGARGAGEIAVAEAGPGADSRGGAGGRSAWQEATARSIHQVTRPLKGLPASSPGPIPQIVDAAARYSRARGLPLKRPTKYVKADPQRGKGIAQAYESMKHDPTDPEVAASYQALIEETLAQYQVIKSLGIKIELIEPGMPDPYPEGPRQVLEDLRRGHLWAFPTESGFGSLNEITDNPLLAPTAEKIGDRTLLANDVFRIVHDVFGHGKEGVGFGPHGEENAWQSHMLMYSPLAQRAMTTETRGQNSWVNFGPYGEDNRADQKNTVYADQKTGLLPAWVSEEGLVPTQEYEQPRRGAIQIGKDRQITISLYEKADLSTFLHESGHLYLEVLGDLVDAINARPAQAKTVAAPPMPGNVRFYHGGNPESVDGPLWFTTSLTDAEGWAARGEGMQVWYVDVPKGTEGIDWGDIENGMPMSSRHELPAKLARRRKPLEQTALPDGEQQLIDDYTSILKWLGVKDRASIGVEQHEQFARGFESYLMEGKAPSVEMQSLFARFRAWLVSIYRTLTALNVNLTDDVRRVMDRLVATDEEIAAANESQNYAPLFANAEQAGMSLEEWAAYRDIATRAHQEATQELTDRALKQLKRETTAWWNEERAKMVDAVTAEVNEQPVYRALAFLQKGQNPDGSPLPDGVQPAKLNKQALIDKYGKEFLKRLPRGITAKDGLSADVVASLVGLDSGDVLVEAIAIARPKTQLIEMEADARMRQQYGDMLTDGSLAEQAMQSVHTEGRAKVLAAELKALNRKRNEVKPFVVAAERQARREREESRAANYGNLLSKEQIREIREQAALQVSLNKDANANDYRRLADSAGRKAFDLAAAGKIEDAAQHKRVEVLNRELYYAALEAREQARAQGERDKRIQQRQAREANEASLPDADELRAIKAAAQRIIGRKKVRDVQPSLYRVAEARAARRAFELASKGNYEDAYIEKRRQILNHELYRAAVKAREAIDSIVEYMRTFDKPATRKRIAKAKGQYLEQIDALRERFEFSRVSNIADLKRDALSKWVAEQEAAGREVNVPDYLLQESRKTPYKELLLAELEGLHDAVRNIEHLAMTKDRMLKNREAAEWEQAKTELLDRVKQALPEGKEPPISRLERDRLDALSDRARAFADSFLRPETIIEWLDGGTAGPWHDYFWNQANDSQDARDALRDRIAKPLFEAAQKIDRERRTQLQEPIHIRSMGRAFKRITLISIALNMGNASNLDKLKRGGYRTKDGAVPFSDMNLQEIANALSRADWEFVQTVWDTINQLWPDIVAFQKHMGGLVPEKIEAVPVQTKHGQFNGGYFPVVYDPMVSTQGEKQAAGDSVGDIMGDMTRASTKKGHTKARTKVARPLLLDFERVLTRHMDQVITDLTHREFLIQALRILDDGDLRAQIQNRISEGAYRSLQGMVRHAVRADDYYGDPAANWLALLQDYFLRNTAVAALGFRAVTAFGNLVLAPVQASARIAPKQILKGIGAFYRAPKQMTGFIHQRSQFMKQRATNMEKSLVEAMATFRGERSIRAQVARVAMSVHRWADFLGTSGLWLAKYRESLEAGESEESAIREADKAIRQTQTASAPKDLSAFERDPHYKAYRLFLGPMIIMQNRIREAVFRRGVVKNWPEAFGTLLAVWFIPAILWEIATGKGPDDDDEPEDVALWALRKVFFYPFMTVPVLRDIATGIEREISGEYAPSRSVPLLEAGELVWNAGKEAYKAGDALYEGDDVNSEALVKDLLRASGPLLGLPSGQLTVTGQYLYDVMSGEYEPEGVGDLRYLVIKRD